MRYTLLFLTFFVVKLFAQIPNGYYNSAAGLKGIALKSALHNIIDNHTEVSYNSLHTHYKVSDKKANGKVWDMYSDIPGGTPPYEFSFTAADQCGNYDSEGDCYNREHTWPQSWFNSASPMVSDMFHVYPTDGYVNAQRGNYPYGEVQNPTWTSQNGSKVGVCTYPEYAGAAFEPIDAYKGDLARTYFYMSTRYYTEDGSWQDVAMANKANLKQWAINMLLEWHHKDVVSTKEINRNNAVYQIQDNRNPFIDHPEYADSIWKAIPLSVNDIQHKGLEVELFPNPANEAITLIINNQDHKPLSIVVYDCIGNTVNVNSTLKNDTLAELNLTELAPGFYFIKIKTDDAELAKKIIVKH